MYSCLNAAKLLTPRVPSNDWDRVFRKAIKLAYKRRKSISFVTNGIGNSLLNQILLRIVCPEFQLTHTRPFHHRHIPTIEEFWSKVTAFLDTTGKRCVIICYGTDAYSHWTVIQTITPKRILLFDSDNRKWLDRRLCTTVTISKETPIKIISSATFFIEKTDRKNI